MSLHHVKSLNVEMIRTLSTHLHVSGVDLSKRKSTLLICFTNKRLNTLRPNQDYNTAGEYSEAAFTVLRENGRFASKCAETRWLLLAKPA